MKWWFFTAHYIFYNTLEAYFSSYFMRFVFHTCLSASLAETKERFWKELRKDTESFRKTFGKLRKEFGKNSDSDCFRILCELCFRFLSECPMNEVFPTVSDFFPNVPPPNSFRTFPNFFRSIPLRRFQFLSEYIGWFNPF